MRQIYIKDIIKAVPTLEGGILEIIDLKPQCGVCNLQLSFIRNKDDRTILDVGDCNCSIPSIGTIKDRTNYKVTKGGKDVGAELELKNGKANPFGWSQYQVWHNGQRIGFLESGALDITDDYSPELGGYIITEKK